MASVAHSMVVILFIMISSSVHQVHSQYNVYISEVMLLQHQDKPYARVYQTEFAPDPDVSPTTYPSSKFKDIYEDNDGNIIIYPLGGDVNNKLFVGIGDYRNQIKFVENYKKQGATNPIIKTFLVPYESVYEIVSKVKKEKGSGKEDDSINVDIAYSNQFGFIRAHIDVLRMKALPGSLVTIAEKLIIGPELGLVKIITMKELTEQWDAKGIPDHHEGEYETIILKHPRQLVMSKVPIIEKGPSETGITSTMLDKSMVYQSRWYGAKQRFVASLDSYVVQIRDCTPDDHVNALKPYDTNKIINLWYGDDQQVKRKINGGFLVGLGDYTKDGTFLLLMEINDKLIKTANLDSVGKKTSTDIMRRAIEKWEK